MHIKTKANFERKKWGGKERIVVRVPLPSHGEVSVADIRNLLPLLGSWQIFSYTKKKAFQTDDLCLDVSAIGGPVKLYQCHGLGGNQLWEYDKQVTDGRPPPQTPPAPTPDFKLKHMVTYSISLALVVVPRFILKSNHIIWTIGTLGYI